MTGSPEDLLATIEAERAIYRTFYHFFRLADTGESERFVECFTPDALIEYRIMPGPVQRFHGRDEFTAYMSRVPKSQRAMVAHVAGQATIEWTEEGPLLTAYATVWHWSTTRESADPNRPADWTTIGLVQDRYQKYDGEWLISHRDVRPVAGRVAAGRGPV
ncbi:nuclear transport factor 2 family protein [Nocardia implantans]|uniref:Nuclear transport factor 2 family protein n=1 Tax=Nocardia implantans TaxID=3108168 RepID=A0ABU6ARY4_9NOCA|nr:MULTISPECIES: nuclear transport factor 2 family protein [unclassified Nocardia]MEA3528006.1 nuclear transport factor 2 family protein [Nocardia sp. CDC192]MEB3510242.1 nuclear transport factor 2 family protein [Nocardia sp. CDC186]